MNELAEQEPNGIGFELGISDFVLGFSRETEPIVCVVGGGSVIDLRNWLTQLWRLANPKPAGWASMLETQRRANMGFKSKGCLMQNSLLLEGNHSFS